MSKKITRTSAPTRCTRFADQKWGYVAEKRAQYIASGLSAADAAIMAEQAADFRCRLEAAGKDGNSNIAFVWSRDFAGRPLLVTAEIDGLPVLKVGASAHMLPGGVTHFEGAVQ
jgi:hypothetical protein